MTERDQTIYDMRKTGSPVGAIAQKLGITESTVYKSEGFKRYRDEMANNAHSNHSTDKDRDLEDILRKLTALMSKTQENGCTEDEAASAAKMASDLLLRYGLTHDDIDWRNAKQGDTNSNYTVGTDTTETPWVHRSCFPWMISLAHAVADVCFCKILLNHSKLTEKKPLRLMWVGAEQDRLVARTLFATLIPQMVSMAIQERQKLYDARTKDNKYIGRNWLASFMAGMVLRLTARMREEFAAELKSNKAEKYALAKFDPVDALFKELSCGKVKTKTSTKLNREGFEQGKKAGDRLVVTKKKSVPAGMAALPGKGK